MPGNDENNRPRNYRQTKLPWAKISNSSANRNTSHPKSGSKIRSGDTDTKPPVNLSSSLKTTDSVTPWCRPQRELDVEAENRKPIGARHNAHRAAIAQETISLIPTIMSQTNATTESHLFVESSVQSPSYWRLGARFSPGLEPVKIRVVNADTLDYAASLLSKDPSRNVCILNMANRRLPGGGWLEGASAQEEQLCFRSTLARTLNLDFYPLPKVSVIYSPAVAVFRAAAPDFKLYSDIVGEPDIISVISAAALDLRDQNVSNINSYRNWERDIMRAKIQLILRIAARKGHTRLVLGAFGCGAFRNPPVEVAQLFKAVLLEDEFYLKGWWHEIVFAIYEGNSNASDENLKVFTEILEGVYT